MSCWSESWKYFEKLPGGEKAQCRVKVGVDEDGTNIVCGRLIGTKSTTALFNHLSRHGIKKKSSRKEKPLNPPQSEDSEDLTNVDRSAQASIEHSKERGPKKRGE